MTNNHYQKGTGLMDAPVPDIGVEPLRPTPFKRSVQSLRDTTKTKWNEYYDWIINYVPPSIRTNPSSAIEKLKNHVRKLYQRSPEFTPVEQEAVKGYFKTFTIPGN